MTPAPPSLRGLRTVVEALEEAGFEVVVVGALATFVWGEPRSTGDLDLAVLLGAQPPSAVRDALRKAGLDPQGPFQTDFGPRFLLNFPESLPVDVFLSGPEQEAIFPRSRRKALGGLELRVISPEDLVLAKLRNAQRFPEERAQDLQDAVGVLFQQWTTFDHRYAAEACGALKVCGGLEAARDEVRKRRQEAGWPV